MYQHRNWQGELLDLPVNKVVCVGSNYQRHIREMGSVTPTEPLLFIKPETALCDLCQPLAIPAGFGAVHHEVELAVLIGETLHNASENQIFRAIAGYAVALDLTLRDVQKQMKQAGAPWEKAKGFDNACPVSGFVSTDQWQADPQAILLSLWVNDELRQQGNTADMIHKIGPLIAYMSRFFTLRAGDVILTGTPEGVGALQSGDQLEAGFHHYRIRTTVL